MNTIQRVILIIGALAFIAVILTTPKVSYYQHTFVEPAGTLAAFPNVYSASVRGAAVLIPTLLLFWAFKGVNIIRIDELRKNIKGLGKK